MFKLFLVVMLGLLAGYFCQVPMIIALTILGVIAVFVNIMRSDTPSYDLFMGSSMWLIGCITAWGVSAYVHWGRVAPVSNSVSDFFHKYIFR
jgi:hypothetical protein